MRLDAARIAAQSQHRRLVRGARAVPATGAKVLALHVEGVPLEHLFQIARRAHVARHAARRHAERDAVGHAAVAAAHWPARRPKRHCAAARCTSRRCRSRADIQRAAQSRRARISKKNCRASIGDVAAHQVGNAARSALGFRPPRRRHVHAERRRVSAGRRPRCAKPHRGRGIRHGRRQAARRRRSPRGPARAARTQAQ